MNRNTHSVNESNAPIIRPINVPNMHRTPEITLKTSALCNDTPARRNTAKSPI